MHLGVAPPSAVARVAPTLDLPGEKKAWLVPAALAALAVFLLVFRKR